MWHRSPSGAATPKIQFRCLAVGGAGGFASFPPHPPFAPPSGVSEQLVVNDEANEGDTARALRGYPER